MVRIGNCICAILSLVCGAAVILAQTPAKSTTAVPRLVKFSGTLSDAGGKPLTGVVGVTFSLYEEQQGGSPVWTEIQNVQAGNNGQYSILLGSTRNEGIPAEAFTAGQRWLGVQAQGEVERPRVLMTSVPYSLKAVDAETLGGLPPSAFALAGTTGYAASGASIESGKAPMAKAANTPASTVTGAGTAGTVPLWTAASTLGNSLILQSGSDVGIGTTSTATKFVVKAAGSLNGIAGEATGATGSGVQGTAIDATGSNIGVLGTSESSAGVGVKGQALATTGAVVGVYGLSESDAGIAVQGAADAASGNTFGVMGTSESSSGIGVQGNTTDTTGTTFGVYGLSASSAGVGVQGEATAATGDTAGIFGSAASTTGIGVAGAASATTGITNGVSGSAASTSGVGVVGTASATTGLTNGVSGSAASIAGVGVSGTASATTGKTTGVYGSAASPQGMGVYGINAAPPGIGVFGAAPATSAESLTLAGTGSVGVWGDSNTGFAGVLGTADNVEAVAAYNNSTHLATLFAENDESTKNDALVLATYSSKYGGYCDIFVNGNLTCSGSKSAVVPVDNGSRQVALYAVEAPENWFEDAGSGRLQKGAAVVRLESVFAQTVNTGMEYHVFLTPKGDCKGLYVTNENSGSFEVHELGGGTSAIAFDYRIMARRKSYENIRLADLTNQIQRGMSSRGTASDPTALQRTPPQAAAVRTTAHPRSTPAKSRPAVAHRVVTPDKL